jgi:ABC-2 type transport system ATP-binding protein
VLIVHPHFHPRRTGATTHVEAVVPTTETERARTALAAVGTTTTADAQHGVAIQVSDPGKAVLDAVRALDAAGVTVESLAIREPTLDDVFLELTGHAAEEEEVSA